MTILKTRKAGTNPSVVDGNDARPPHPQRRRYSSHDDDAPTTQSRQQNEDENGPETMEATGRGEATGRDEETKR